MVKPSPLPVIPDPPHEEVTPKAKAKNVRVPRPPSPLTLPSHCRLCAFFAAQAPVGQAAHAPPAPASDQPKKAKPRGAAKTVRVPRPPSPLTLPSHCRPCAFFAAQAPVVPAAQAPPAPALDPPKKAKPKGAAKTVRVRGWYGYTETAKRRTHDGS